MKSKLIDVHHHILPSHYVEEVGIQGLAAQAASGKVPEWSLERTLELMDAAGITTAVTSISTPGVSTLDEAPAIKLARSCNEFAAGLKLDHPSRFGFFATLPLQSLDAVLDEIAYSYDTLGADGVCLLSNYGGRYLGDVSFTPLYEELSRRNAVVFMHPTSPVNPVKLPDLSPSMLEFPFDTTRTIASLIFSGVPRNFPAIRWIFSHAGGALPYLAGRFEVLSKNNPILREQIPGGFYEAVKPFYFDVALSANAVHFAALRKIVSDRQILFGTDYPFGPKDQIASTISGLNAQEFSRTTLSAIMSTNALRLFPGLTGADFDWAFTGT